MTPNIFCTLQDSMIVSIRDRSKQLKTIQRQNKSLAWGGEYKATYKPFLISEKNDSLRISSSSYSEASILSSSELTSPFLMILPASNSHLSKFPFRHLWQEQIFYFPIIRPSGKKAIMCNFSHCKILNSSLGCFLISARWSSETTLYNQFGLSRCFCSKCSFTCSTSLKKQFSVMILFRRGHFTRKLLIESTSPLLCPETP